MLCAERANVSTNVSYESNDKSALQVETSSCRTPPQSPHLHHHVMHMLTDIAKHVDTFRKERRTPRTPRRLSRVPKRKPPVQDTHTFEESMIHANAHFFGKKNCAHQDRNSALCVCLMRHVWCSLTSVGVGVSVCRFGLAFTKKNRNVHVEWRCVGAKRSGGERIAAGSSKGLETQSQTALAVKEMLRSKECERMTVCTRPENKCGAVFV